MKHLPRAAPVTMERYRTKNDRAATIAARIIATVLAVAVAVMLLT